MNWQSAVGPLNFDHNIRARLRTLRFSRIMQLLALALAPMGNMYDVIMPSYVSGCPNGCAAWATVGEGQLWANGARRNQTLK